MKISMEEVVHVAQLARLEPDPAAMEKFAGQIGKILAYMDKLNQVDTADVPPTTHAISLTNAFRADEVHAHLDPETALANAPEKEDSNFIVPRVI